MPIPYDAPRPHPRVHRLLLAALLVLSGSACRGSEPDGRETRGAASEPAPDTALAATLRRATLLADSIEDLLRPVPLMRSTDEEALRRYPNAAHVRAARRLGVRPEDGTGVDRLVETGRLVPLEDSTGHWVLREMSASRPLVTPGTRRLLERIGQRFQQRLTDMGLPPLRFEISSATRTPESQAALRRTNPNAAAGTSAHEFGTTVDIPYSAYAAPADLPPGLVATGDEQGDAPGGVSGEESAALEVVARYVVERMAARKSRELKAILGSVLRDMQAGGEVLVTLERRQPVYHITVADG